MKRSFVNRQPILKVQKQFYRNQQSLNSQNNDKYVSKLNLIQILKLLFQICTKPLYKIVYVLLIYAELKLRNNYNIICI